MNLEDTADWGCSLLYKRTKEPISWDDTSDSGCTTDIGPLDMLKYLNLNGKKFEHFLPEDINRLHHLQYLDISDWGRRELPELPTPIRELYANAYLASESNIAELATKYSELYSVSFSHKTYLVPGELAKKFIPITQPFLNRNTTFAVTYPLDTSYADYKIRRCFKYPHHGSNNISVSLDPFWYSHNFVGFVVCFVFPRQVRWESRPSILPFRHCELITKLTHKDNGSDEPPLLTKCSIGRLYDEENFHISGDKLVCFAYIPFSSLWPKSKAITDNTTPNHYLVFEATIQDLEFSSNWSFDLLYRDDELLTEEILKKRDAGSNKSDSEKGVEVFKDDKQPEKGQYIASTVLEAIQKSRMAVVVFSTEYASSAACLEELAIIMECKEMLNQVVPIFYSVEPLDIRGQTGSFEEAFSRHEKKFKDDDGKAKVEGWRKALRKAGSIDGLQLELGDDYYGRRERRCLERLVSDIFEKLCLAPSIPKTFVGLELRLKDTSTLMLKHWKDVKLIGIWGMSGIGKTTIARATFAKFSSAFEDMCFLADIGERHSKHGLKALQERLLSYTLKEIPMHIDDLEKGIQMIKERLKWKKVLIVLDDVDQQEQLDKLVGDGKWLCNGSRVIITTRLKHLFTQFGVAVECYEVKKLDEEEALKLFSWHAFNEESPEVGFEDLSRSFVTHASGLPLTLEEWGSMLCGQGEKEWESTLKKIKGIPVEKVCDSEQRDEEAPMIEDGSEHALIPEKSATDAALFEENKCRVMTQPDPIIREQMQSDDYHIEEDCKSIASEQELGIDSKTKEEEEENGGLEHNEDSGGDDAMTEDSTNSGKIIGIGSKRKREEEEEEGGGSIRKYRSIDYAMAEDSNPGEDEERGESLDCDKDVEEYEAKEGNAGHGVKVAISEHNDSERESSDGDEDVEEHECNAGHSSVNEEEEKEQDKQRKKACLDNKDKEDIIINSGNQNKGKNEQNDGSGELLATNVQPLFVDDDVFQRLGNDCKQLYNLLREVTMEYNMECIDVELDANNIFHHTKMKSIFVMIKDIKDLFTMNWLDVSIIQVFIMYLYQLCKDSEVSSIGFMCPTQIAKANNVDMNVKAVMEYLRNTMSKLQDKTFILAPYHQVNHWLLLVICTSSRMVYVLDPMQCDRELEIKPVLNMAFRTFMNQRGQRARCRVNWKNIKCPRQPRNSECGYYVMRYMYDICRKYFANTSLDEAFQETEAYSDNEIDEIRNLWANYFIKECV